MKSTLLLIYFLLPAFGFAQKQTYTMADMPNQIDSVTGGMVYRGVVDVSGVSADELYGRARSFLSKAFNNTAKFKLDNKANGAFIQVDDRADGLLAGKGIIQPNQSLSGQVISGGMYYVVPFEVRVKDGRYRYELSNIQISNGNSTLNIDEAMRKNPKGVQQALIKTYSQKEYDKFMKGAKPFTDFIDALKQAMSRKEAGKDF